MQSLMWFKNSFLSLTHTHAHTHAHLCVLGLMVENDGKRLISRNPSVNTSVPFTANRK